VESQLKGTTSLVLVGALTDLRTQLAGLVFPGFVSQLGWRRLPDVERYLLGAQRRLEKLPNAPLADGERLQVIQRVQDAYEDLLMSRAAAHRPKGADVHEIRWMIEELRVSLFAQTLRTAYPVSEKRILKAIDAADGS
jgi:ATP-dependent helicase HrpA